MPTYKDIEPIINDFTDRVRLLQTDYKDLPWAKSTEMDFTEIVMTLKKAPTADVQEVRHGHWIKDPESGITRCSECDWTLEVAWESNYCPDCGAKMYEEVTK